MMLARLIGLLAGLLGAAGVGAAALAAHGGYGDNLRTASVFALVHAALILALVLRRSGRLATLAACVVLLGALLFCGDLAMRALAGRALAPMAAPTGGFLMMAGWLLAGATALLDRKPS